LWVFADRNRAGAYLIQALLGAALFGFFFLSTLFLQDVFGYKPLKAGAAFVPATVIMMVAAGLVPRLIGRIGVRPLIASGTAIAAVGMWLLGQLQPHSTYLTGVLVPMTVLAIGLGMVFVPATLSAVSGVDEEHSGLVSGVSTTAIQIGGAIGVAILATVAATTTRHATPGTLLREALTNGYTHAFHIGALVIALAVPIALVFLRLRPSTGQVSSEPAGADRITVTTTRSGILSTITETLSAFRQPPWPLRSECAVCTRSSPPRRREPRRRRGRLGRESSRGHGSKRCRASR
jgi:MFS family permease